MGFIVSRLYKGQSFFILILKAGLAQDTTVVDEFFFPFLSGFKTVYMYKNECISYKKLRAKGRTASIIEMHDTDHLHLFWDCIAGMHYVVYFIHSLSNENALAVIGQIKSVRDVNQGASLLLVIMQNKIEQDEYELFKKSLQKSLEGATYKIIDNTLSTLDRPSNVIDDLFHGVMWETNPVD
ncbi:hypothetical protein NEPAR06_0192 [Nematocida parisii]|uniref:Uncharacterized protein n=1 Tax=Nematocida parisii (strain ERTm3) TaxID=935791 RepID=I3EDE1_NEMP3|nr:uncharacterized protein NEPG_00588 [Nematocida parisii ERTm1]EIJ87238.1 hypothetical protein NEQG_02573 [Nematocida parisii ERTm3]KAI5126621.1 hypothetical protein NEPAR08_0540 [Nematocida parisii]EIJ95063.1 hypothetical protein NEPG_00588 [Nematocida parisii ERTm1]KAI5127904.1 hypothetical protein NEPAR03_1184 [Nematocida parisii]KAI5142842.1 hypothetical protein NEPAR04_1662 [Nematocida parisii]|eukprot:XP_013058419.1 hypothetical protein NEPG_00588 [Nematocida parisii ERTm1]